MKILRYQPYLKKYSVKLRKNSTLSEIILWKRINKKQLGFTFLRQKPIGFYIVDFYCPKKKLVVEIDGISHSNKFEYDQERLKYLNSLGLKTLILSDLEVKRDIRSAVQSIINKLGE